MHLYNFIVLSLLWDSVLIDSSAVPSISLMYKLYFKLSRITLQKNNPQIPKFIILLIGVRSPMVILLLSLVAVDCWVFSVVDKPRTDGRKRHEVSDRRWRCERPGSTARSIIQYYDITKSRSGRDRAKNKRTECASRSRSRTSRRRLPYYRSK